MSRRGENIYKRKDGRWEGRIAIERKENGRLRYRSVYARTYADVKFKLKNYIEIPRKTDSDVSDWIYDYIVSLKDSVKLSTYSLYMRSYRKHLLPYFKGVKLRELTKGSIQGFVDSRRDLSPSTVRGLFNILRGALKKAYEKGLVDAIWLGIMLPKNKRRVTEVFTKHEQELIEDCIDTDKSPNEIGILICLYTGLRIGELCGLKWEDIDFDIGVLTVNRTVQRISINGRSQLTEMTPKSEYSQRRIPIPSFLLKELERLRANSRSDYVISCNSHIMDPRTYQYQFKSFLKKAGVRENNFHSLRHTFSVRALELDFDIKTLSEILGHSNAVITLKTYAHSLDEHKRASMERLSSLRSDNS